MKRDKLSEEFAEHLKMIRTAKNISIYRLSRLSSMSETQIRDIEKGRRNPSFVTLHLLSKGLGVSICELVDVSREESHLSEAEVVVLETFRSLTPEKAAFMLNMLNQLAKM